MKKNKEEEFWPRLIKEDKKFQNITFDWEKYVDEDEQDEQPNNEQAGPGWDPEQMNSLLNNNTFIIFKNLARVKKKTRKTKTTKQIWMIWIRRQTNKIKRKSKRRKQNQKRRKQNHKKKNEVDAKRFS